MGNGATCEDPNPTTAPKEACFQDCPAGQMYSTTESKCFATCPKNSAHGSGDPHYTTFDGVYYTIFPQCSHVAAEDCQGQTWSVYHVTSNQCSGGRAPTCIDESILRVPRLGTMVRYSRLTNSYSFIGNTPAREDMAVTLSGSFFTANLPKEDVTVQHYSTVLTVTVGIRWFGKVCGLFGNWDKDRSNEFALRNGTTVGFNSPLFTQEYNADKVTGVCPEPPPPPPPPPACSGAPLAAAETFCSALSDTSGSYASCHATLPTGNTYAEPVDSPYEQCVYDHCVVGSEAGCTDILGYASECRDNGFKVGDPPTVCSKLSVKH